MTSIERRNIKWKIAIASGLACPLVGCIADPSGVNRTQATDEQSIIGGVTDTGDPSVVGLFVHRIGESGARCTASMISTRTVLTAANCVSPTALIGGKVIEVFTGPTFSNPPYLQVTSTALDPQFDPSNLGNGHDIAVIQLAAATTLAPLEYNRSGGVGTGPARIVGYGVNVHANTGGNVKRQATTTMTPEANGVLKVGNSTTQACSGDFGGPVFQTIGGHEVIVGVASFTDPSVTPEVCFGGAHYSPVHPFASFIDDHILFTQREIFRGTDGHLHAVYNDGAHWASNVDLTAKVPQSARPVGEPSAYTLRTTQHIVFRSNDTHIHEFFHNGISWVDNDLTAHKGGAGAKNDPSGDPSGYVFGDTQHIVFRGTDNHLHELYNDGSSWISNNDLTSNVGNSVPPAGPPFGYVLGNTQHIVFRGTDGHLHEFHPDVPNHWADRDLTTEIGGAAPSGDPTGYVLGNTQHILFRGIDGHLHDLAASSDSSDWTNHDLNNEASSNSLPAGSPFGYVLGNTPHVVFRSSNDHLHEFRLAGVNLWIDTDLTQQKGGAGPANNPSGYVMHNTQHIIFKGTDGHVHEFFHDGSDWVNNDLNNQPGVGGVGPDGRASGYISVAGEGP